MIRKEDRVSAVLRADESLIEVFVALSPAFERLRNAGMRKVMSRLVSVEQAARIAGVDADELVARLNAHGPVTRLDVAVAKAAEPSTAGASTAGPSTAGTAAAAPTAELPAELALMPEDHVLEIDVREDLRNGKEPFSRIMAARRDVPPGGALRVRAIFEPVPLYSVLEKQGFARHHAEQLGADDWRVWFYAAPDGAAPTSTSQSTSAEPDRTDAGIADDVIVLDVRGLEPPEPMVRTLAALESLPADATLVQINVRVPRFLLPLLDERGFTYEIREQNPELVRLFIRRAPADRALETVDTQQARISE